MVPESELTGVELFKIVAPFNVIVTLPKSSLDEGEDITEGNA